MWTLRATALGELRLLPGQYWTLTLSELGELLRGEAQRERRCWEMAAWQTALLINVSGKSVKRAVHPDDLLGLTHERRQALDERWRADQEAERLRQLKAGEN